LRERKTGIRPRAKEASTKTKPWSSEFKRGKVKKRRCKTRGARREKGRESVDTEKKKS